MKKLSIQSAKVLTKIINMMNGEDYLKIDNTNQAFMPVVIEKIDLGVPNNIAGLEFKFFSVAHYFEQNGDLVVDPEMIFAVSIKYENWIYPMSFQDQYKLKQSISYIDGTWKVWKKEQHDQAVFSNMWLKNIKFQQGL